MVLSVNRNSSLFHSLVSLCFLVLTTVSAIGQSSEERPPNFIIIFADDLGYGDLGVFGHPTIRTPHLDRMAQEGQKWTNFYVAASVCTPSRAALLTGRLPVRSGMASDVHRVLFPNSVNGLPSGEITLAEQLKQAGYTTACIGKWHLGHKSEYLPTQNGFDYYFGIPYSNDMDFKGTKRYRDLIADNEEVPTGLFDVPLMRNTEIIERPANQNTITKRYGEEALAFLEAHKTKPFFLYLAHNLPHIPLYASKEYVGKSARGLYGDVVSEIDAGVGKILSFLEEQDLAENTIVVFTSDNGPWLSFGTHGGSAGLLRAGKGSTWEGGMRVPTIFWNPGRIQGGVTIGLGSTLDLFTTFSNLAGVPLPKDRVLDGFDLSPALFKNATSPRKQIFYYRGTELYAVRHEAYKLHYITEGAYGMFGKKQRHDPPLLYHLGEDPSEQFDIAGQHPEFIDSIRTLVQAHQATMVLGKDQLAERE
ncbi:sulfatase [Flavobacteriaceae bacterium TP-CH-4]|uniref:Sulfatase n=1 Tax=Pelagihabitans pacificus TaxID=2696054 RepID=A0A967B1Q0_9FLAO|nr:sulfatase [Pelagihabitans pacificus]NHF60461.1 sulfatase [Pelagihabitans pacificus]